jgi:hypothetical protein
VASALRGLLPLRVNNHEHTLNAAENALSSQLGTKDRNSLIASLLKVSRVGSSNVEQEFLRAIDAAINLVPPTQGGNK